MCCLSKMKFVDSEICVSFKIYLVCWFTMGCDAKLLPWELVFNAQMSNDQSLAPAVVSSILVSLVYNSKR